ncbi:SCO family protein [Methylobrevis albus]|uniref:SCO family protein n=1 Tax=Methylobrevis albus TaxID=2793297 RepID=A0A931I2G8_9HYPH|nr:SCO family protein [Methylobrevis albus]MBH0238249.1 SCO family protein [Methylobrevis albus]
MTAGFATGPRPLPSRRSVLSGLGFATACGLAGLRPAAAHEAHGAAAVPVDPLAGRFGGPFTLTSHRGTRVSDTDFRGALMLVYFGFTHCVDVCPVDLAVQQGALAEIGDLASRIQPLFITVDPARDTPEVLASYLAPFHPATLGLTGTEAEIAAVAKAYRVHRRRVPLDGPEAEHLRDAAGAYIVDHGALTFLMGPDGRFLTLVPHGAGIDRLATLLAGYAAKA